MQIIRDESEYRGPGTVIALGTFDGVHIGHQALILTAEDLARRSGLDAAVCTFDRHPLALLRPGAAPRPLLTQADKMRKLERLGVDLTLVKPFTRAFAAQPARTFLERLAEGMKARAVVVGENYTFGRGGEGDSALLKTLAPELGFEAVVVEPVMDEGEMVSSTLIRRLIEEGDSPRAKRLMGEI